MWLLFKAAEWKQDTICAKPPTSLGHWSECHGSNRYLHSETQNDWEDNHHRLLYKIRLGAHWNTFRISWIPWITHNRHPQKSFSHTPSVKKTSLIMAERTSMTDVWQDHTSPIPRLLWSLSWQPHLRTLVGGTGGLMVDQHKQISIWLSLNPWYGVNSPVKLCHWELSLSRMTASGPSFCHSMLIWDWGHMIPLN